MSVPFAPSQLQGPRGEAAKRRVSEADARFRMELFASARRIPGNNYKVNLDRRASIPHRSHLLRSPLLIIHRLHLFKQSSSRKRAREMDHRLPRGVPAIRLSSRLQLATTFGAEPAPSSRRRSRGPPPAMTADVRVVIRRHFPVVGPGCTRVAEKVAADIALRRRPSRGLRLPERVERALADEVLPLVSHPFDRGAVAAARGEICAHVAAACGDQRVARGGARVLVVIDTFACPVVLRSPAPPCNKPAPRRVVCAPGNLVAPAAARSMGSEITAPAKKANPYGVIGDRRPKPVAVVEETPKLEGFGTVAGWTDSFSIFR